MSDAVHGLNLVVEAADGRREALPVGDDELVAEGPRHQHDVVVDEAAKRHCISHCACPLGAGHIPGYVQFMKSYHAKINMLGGKWL